MDIHPIAGVVYLFGVALLSAAPLDDKVKTFEEAIKNAPAITDPGSLGIPPQGRIMTADDLEQAIQRNADEAEIAAIISRLMATHPSETVVKTGSEIISILQKRSEEQAKIFDTKAETTLAKAPEIVTHASKATDLDQILGDLQTLQRSLETQQRLQTKPELATEISSAFEFITQWQNYLAAAANGNWQEAQNNLRSILYNRGIDAPNYFPRSLILEKYEETFPGHVKTQISSSATDSGDEMDKILESITEPKGEESKIGDLTRIPTPNGQPWDWSSMLELVKKKDDVLAGFSTDLDLKKIMAPPIFGDDISRITAMELRVILPHYLGTSTTEPPKEKETIAAYLDRLVNKADADGNLALMQRVISVQVALTLTENPATALGTQQFLAGLSQEAAGQYTPAVISYENSLKDPDPFLPIKIVGERLAAIKAAHSDEFEKGMTTFLTPSVQSDPRFPQMPWMRPGQFGNPSQFQISVLPIPTTITIPAASPETGTVQKTGSTNPASSSQ
jgi:hypothetical protein